MLATNALTHIQATQLRCAACRYFVHDRCSHSTARLSGEESKDGDCPFFRYAQSQPVVPGY